MFHTVTSLTISILVRFISPSLWLNLKTQFIRWWQVNSGTNAHVDRQENQFCKCNTFIYIFAHWLHLIYSLLCFFPFTPPMIALLLNYRECSDMHRALMSGCIIKAAALVLIKTTQFRCFPSSGYAKWINKKIKRLCDVPTKCTQESRHEWYYVFCCFLRGYSDLFTCELKSKQWPDAQRRCPQWGGHDNRLFLSAALPANCEIK